MDTSQFNGLIAWVGKTNPARKGAKRHFGLVQKRRTGMIATACRWDLDEANTTREPLDLTADGRVRYCKNCLKGLYAQIAEAAIELVLSGDHPELMGVLMKAIEDYFHDATEAAKEADRQDVSPVRHLRVVA